jgi:hypothetical protein
LATSGSTDFTLNRDEIIREALDLIGVMGISQDLSNADLESCNRSLNNLIKAWQAQGIHLWSEQEATVFLDTTSESYTLSSTGDHASDTVVETTLSADEALGQTVLSITDTTGMTAADNVGIELDDGTRQWTTIVSVDSSTQITVTASLTAAAASGNTVYTYTTKLNRPLDVIHVRVRNKSGTDIELERLGKQDYYRIADKNAGGLPSQYFYDPQRDSGELYVWAVSTVVTNRLKITYRRDLEDFDSAADNPDIPQEWMEALIYNLAVRIAPKFNKTRKIQEVIGLAEQMKQDLLEWDQDHANLMVAPVGPGGYR